MTRSPCSWPGCVPGGRRRPRVGRRKGRTPRGRAGPFREEAAGQALPNDDAKLRELYGRMEVHRPMLLVIHQPATIGALPVVVALNEGVTVAYLPGLAMRRIADLHPGSAKTDARDAAVIANAARTMPHTLQALKVDDETIAELTVMSGFDDDLAGQITATSYRIRGLHAQIHPALERVLGPRLDHPAVLDLLETWPTPAALTAAGKTRVRTRLLKKAPRLGGRFTEEIFAALAAQTVVVTGTNAAGIVLPRLAAQLAALRQQRAEVAEQVEELVAAQPRLAHLAPRPITVIKSSGHLRSLHDTKGPQTLITAVQVSPAGPNPG